MINFYLINIKKIFKYPAILIMLIVVLGTFLRLKGLTFQSYWTDELFSAYTSNPDFSLKHVIEKTIRDVHPPLYQIVLWSWYKLFGYTEMTGRLLSAVIGTLSLIAVYFAGKEFGGEKAGFYSALIACTNYFHIHYSQEARSNILLFLFSSLIITFLYRIIKNNRNKDWIFFFITSLIAIYTHYFGIILVGTAFIIYGYFYLKNRSKYSIYQPAVYLLLLIISYSPMMVYILKLSQKKNYWMPKPEWYFLIDYFKAYFRSIMIEILFGLLSISTLRVFWKKLDSNAVKGIGILLALIFFSYLIPYIRSITSTPLMIARNTIITLPAIFVFVALGLTHIKSKLVERGLCAILILLSFHCLLIATKYYETISKTQYREMAIELKDRSEPMFAMKYTPLDYNMYFIFLNSSNRASSFDEFARKIQKGEAEVPNEYWLLDGHHNIFKTDISVMGKSELVKEIKKHNAAARLYRRL